MLYITWWNMILFLYVLLLTERGDCYLTASSPRYPWQHTQFQTLDGKHRRRMQTKGDDALLPQSVSLRNDDATTSNQDSKKNESTNFANGKPIPKNKQNKNSSQRKFHRNDSNSRKSEFVLLNQKIIAAETPTEVMQLLVTLVPSALTKTAGGGALNSVNFATCLHRLGRYVSQHPHERAVTLSDPKFALLLCSLSEALAGLDPNKPLASVSIIEHDENNRLSFSRRERTNLVWALAKMRIVPPFRALPWPRNSVSGSDKDTAEHLTKMIKTSIQLRRDVLLSSSSSSISWIPMLSLLSAQIMDTIALQILDDVSLSSSFNPTLESSWNVQEMVNMLWAFAAAQRAPNEVMDQIVKRLTVELMDNGTTNPSGSKVSTGAFALPNPQEFSNAIWACATAQYTGLHVRTLVGLIARNIALDPRWISRFKPQEISNTAWGIATLWSQQKESGIDINSGDDNGCMNQEENHDLNVVTIFRAIAKTVLHRCDDFKSQEISNTIWAFGTLGFGIVADKRNLNDFIVLNSDDYESDVTLVTQTLNAVSRSATGRLRVFKEQELNNLAHGCGRLGRCEPELFAGIAYEFGRRHGRVTGQDIGTTLWSFATTKYWERHSFESVLSRLRIEEVENWKPQEISNIAWALGTAGISSKYPKAFDVSLVLPSERATFQQVSKDPVTFAFAAISKELLNRPGQFKTQELKDSLWGLSKAGIRHPLVFRTIAEYLVGREFDKVPKGKLHTGVGLENFSSQEIANLCWAYAKQGQLAAENSETLNGRMAVYCATAVDIGETLMKRFINCASESNLANYGDFSRFSTTDLSNTLWSLATLGYRHERFIQVSSKQILSRCQKHLSGEDISSMTFFRGQEICNVVWSLATLNCISSTILDIVARYIESLCKDTDGKVTVLSISKYLNRQEMGNIAWSCAVAGHYPPALIRLLLKGLVGTDESQQSPEYLELMQDEKAGISDHTKMTLFYLQYGMILDGAQVEGANMPHNLPSDWGDDSVDFGNILDDESGMSLSLTTSKVQQDVSLAFSRIGFSHEEEFIVPMDPIMKMNLLSLDIADPIRKIGIEVDGPSHFYHDLDQWTPQDPPKGQVRVAGRKVEYDFDWNANRNKPNGSTCLKDRLLRRLGWKVIHIPFWEWYPMKGNQSAEDDYCRKLLENL